MNASLSRSTQGKLISFHPTYENVHALLAEIHLYVFGPDGRLIDSQAIRRDRVAIALDDEALRSVRVLIAPPVEGMAGELPGLAAARAQCAFETELWLDDGQASYTLPPVPEAIWRWWLVHSLWKNVSSASKKRTGLLGW